MTEKNSGKLDVVIVSSARAYHAKAVWGASTSSGPVSARNIG